MEIRSFRGNNRFLSNFYLVRLFNYPSNENFFQAMKFPKGSEHREKIRRMTPGQAKRYARENNKEWREDWRDINLEVMFTGLKEKFRPGSVLAQHLITTGDAYLVEGNYWHDNFWGDCTCENKDGKHPDCLGGGENYLGQMLMWIREELIDPHAHDTCIKCDGSGKWLFAGHFENGVWKGKVGKCFQCQGTGKETIYDRLRTNVYYNRYYQIPGV